jgi:hypothetical protein
MVDAVDMAKQQIFLFLVLLLYVIPIMPNLVGASLDVGTEEEL